VDAVGFKDFIITAHARFEMQRRGIGEDQVRKVVTSPGQRMTVRPGRVVMQSRAAMDGKSYLLRVFVDIGPDKAEVVTVYRTSRIEKYWRAEE
jgi:hypothetical protein